MIPVEYRKRALLTLREARDIMLDPARRARCSSIRKTVSGPTWASSDLSVSWCTAAPAWRMEAELRFARNELSYAMEAMWDDIQQINDGPNGRALTLDRFDRVIAQLEAETTNEAP